MAEIVAIIRSVNWWAVASLLFLLTSAIITVVSMGDGVDNVLLFRNLTAWLNTAGVVSAIFALYHSIDGLRREQMRRAYDPELRKTR